MTTETAKTSLLEVVDLHTHFNTSRGVAAAVDGVSFSLERGCMIGIVGESGSGKSVFVAHDHRHLAARRLGVL